MDTNIINVIHVYVFPHLVVFLLVMILYLGLDIIFVVFLLILIIWSI